jgi:hypothetical protein
MIVYKATHKENGKVYIGYTSKTLDKRIYNHFKKSTNAKEKAFNQAFKLALRKYGRDAFTWEELFVCETKEDACAKEIEFIKEYNSVVPNGYNMTLGGEGGIPNEDVKKRISESLKKFNRDNPKYFVNKYMEKTTSEQRSEKAKKAWRTKKQKGFKPRSGFNVSQESRAKMSITKNNKNACLWYNIKTGETTIASSTLLSQITKTSFGALNHIKNGRQYATKTGWTFISKLNSFCTEQY